MVDGVASLVIEIVNRALSPVLDTGIKGIIEKIRKKRIITRIDEFLREYINDHDGTILTSGSFERYLINFRPIEQILMLSFLL